MTYALPLFALFMLACSPVDDPVGAVDPSTPGAGGASGAGGTSGTGGTSGGGGGAASASGTSAQAGAAGAGAPGASGSSGAGAGGAPAAPVCTHTNDRLEVSLEHWDGITYECSSHHDSTPVVFEGQITEVVDGERVTLSPPCGPDAKCSASHLTVKIAGQPFPAPVGAFVRVNLRAWSGLGGVSCCFVRLEVTNLASLDGVINPVDPVEHLWLAGSDGNLDDSPLPGLSVSRVAQGCSEQMGGCGVPADEYRLRFTESGSVIEVTMGQPAAWSPPGAGGRAWTVRNNRSYSSGLCDDYCEFGYVITSP